MLISKNDLLFLIVMCFFCSNMYLCKKVKQADATCSLDTSPLVKYTGSYKDNKWQGTMTYDLKDKNNECCGKKTFLSDCSIGRCVFCCRRDMQEEVNGWAFNTNPVPDTRAYSNNPLLKCCSSKTLTTSRGRVYCCSSDVVINSKEKYYLDKSGNIVSLLEMYGIISKNIPRDTKNEEKFKCQ